MCTWHGGGGHWWCCGGVAHVQRLRAVLWLFERRRERDFFPFSSLPLVFSGSLCSFFVLGLFFSFVIFSFVPSLPSLTFVLSLLSFLLRSLLFLVFFRFLVPFFPFLFYSLFIGEKGHCALHQCVWGAGFAAAGWPPPATTKRRSLAFEQGERPVGQWLWSVVPRYGASGRWPRGERGRFKEEKHHFSSFFCIASGRKKKGESCRSKRHRSVLLFFYV